ncbi:hypothetical protein ACWT_4214 [Actinoplanes sp. SE50]|uniref:hypothetical protein n=1 Tax=unclassified Actinoplanes TaxID=2626549 RepID=UPI00023EC2D6|nr:MULTISPECIES: hypothetical protein [unclassified Actinoplanes]AEV85234.1 hypothetical protein ACPL_4343 [Actinoplanes sp. SE50/110]ATO83629.1 hypothetical protein ACWT_4214 [Actinoplanes sp. SE50]SLM01037.1 hypothetical protein ACSP50_4270 [Actinoplanes sp. SE50/110]
MVKGRIVAESLRPGAALVVPGLELARVARVAVAAPGPGQPAVWTLLDVVAPEERSAELAAALSAALAPDGGWYADFRSGGEHVVVFAGRVFRYAVGDGVGRAEAVAYGRSLGVPRAQLDWGP